MWHYASSVFGYDTLSRKDFPFPGGGAESSCLDSCFRPEISAQDLLYKKESIFVPRIPAREHRDDRGHRT